MRGKRISVIDLIRLYLIFALIICHAFAPFSGAWDSITPENIGVYKWLARFSYASMLESFVLISGYLFSKKTASHDITLVELFSDKLKRLYLPALLFGLLYVLVLRIPFNTETFLRIFNGIGNLWFLPMLLWVFLLYWSAQKFIRNTAILTILLMIVAVLPYPTLPLQLNNSFYYLFFFHVGCLLAKSDGLNSVPKTPLAVCTLFVVYVLMFFLSYYIRETFLAIPEDISMVKKACYICIRHICRFSYSAIGIWVIYSFFSILDRYISKDLTSIANLCFGVYLVHEMILRSIYYQSCALDYVDVKWLPWLAALVTLLLSILISKLLKSFKYTRSML